MPALRGRALQGAYKRNAYAFEQRWYRDNSPFAVYSAEGVFYVRKIHEVLICGSQLINSNKKGKQNHGKRISKDI